MLNEIREYEQYTQELNETVETKSCRLSCKSLKSDLAGIERPLVIIARHEMFLNEDEPEEIKENEIIEVLKAWCGLDYDSSVAGTEIIAGWMEKYLNTVLKNKTNEENKEKSHEEQIKNIKKIISQFKQMRKKYFNERTMICSDSDESDTKQKSNKKQKANTKKKSNTFYSITYDKILAEAYSAGKLRRYYLVSEEDPFVRWNVIKDTGKKKLKIAEKEKDRILKGTAIFLFNKGEFQNSAAYVNWTNLSNWCGLSSLDALQLEKFIIKDRDTGEERTLVEKETLKTGEKPDDGSKTTLHKMRIHPEWIKMFQIVPDDQLDTVLAENKNRVFYSDFGSDYDMSKNKSIRYS